MPALVVIFLRGGADGLALVPPHADDRLYALRPALAAPRPDQRALPAAERTLDLDSAFGLHPSLAPLAPLFVARELAIVHAVGSDDTTRSHFEAQDRMELAGARAGAAAGGWIARHLATRPGPRPGSLAAVALGPRAPESLRGAAATALERSGELARPPVTEALAASLEDLYALDRGHGSQLADAAIDALHVSRTLADLALGGGPRVDRYPAGELGPRLAEAAHLLRHRRELGVEVVTVDQQGWDTHFVQRQALGPVAGELALSLAAFRADLDDAFADTVVVVMTEFGRRAYENVTLGTDHGRASVMLLLGGALPGGGKVHGRFPGLDESQMDPPGDLAVTTDHRLVLRELLRGPLGNPRCAEVFPGLEEPRVPLSFGLSPPP